MIQAEGHNGILQMGWIKLQVVFSSKFSQGEGDHSSISEALHAELFDRVGDVYQNTGEELESGGRLHQRRGSYRFQFRAWPL